LTGNPSDMPTPVVARKRKRVHQPTVRYNAVKDVGSSGRLRELIAFDDTPPPSSTTSPSTTNGASMYAAPIRTRSRAAAEAQVLSPIQSSSFVTVSPAPKKRKSDYCEGIRTPEAKKPVDTSSRQSPLDPTRSRETENDATTDNVSHAFALILKFLL
jgi:dual-specificity kinase